MGFYNMFKIKTRLIILALATFPVMSFGQIKVSQSIQQNTLAQSETNKLYFVDFWATWCGPCVPAKKYLGTLQKQFPNDFYIVSISDENPETVKKYLNRRKTDLAIAIDYDKQTFSKYSITTLPQGILFNAKGVKLWQGHSANLSPELIKRYLNTTDTRLAVEDFVKLEAYKKVEEKVDELNLIKDFNLEALDASGDILQVKHSGQFVIYEGKLQSILAYLNGVSDHQIELPPELSQASYKLSIAQYNKRPNNLIRQLLRTLKLKMEMATRRGEIVEFVIETPKFWDTTQINWGVNNPKYLISDDQIQADNVRLTDVIYRLSNLLKKPLIAEGVVSNDEHDWQIHYKFFELMQSDLLDNYGIRAEKKMGEYAYFTIRKKAP